ncbi:MAG TPA: hypothetical protein VK794_05820 [Steroidobacteraceae bacterium]|nr:hypothetical protein [Steroidobacteraceae bacterium]
MRVVLSAIADKLAREIRLQESSRKSGPVSLRREQRAARNAKQNLTSRLFFPHLRFAVDGHLERRSANEKILFF